MFRKKPKIDHRQEQKTKLEELGSKLQEIRTERGVSLQTVGKQTRIPLRLLKAIEAADLDSLPEPIYIRGLIRRFGDTLGLDGLELGAQFPVELELKSDRSYFSWRLPSLQLRPIHLYFLYILLVVVSVRGISEVLRKSALETTFLESQPKLEVSASKKTNSTTPETVKNKNNSGKPVVVNIELKDKCWLKVVVDGKTEFVGELPGGTHRTWSANEQVTVRAGNAGGVLITLNDQAPKKLGEYGKIEEITFQASSHF